LFEFFPNGSPFINIIRPQDPRKQEKTQKDNERKKKIIIVLVSLEFATSGRADPKGSDGAIAHSLPRGSNAMLFLLKTSSLRTLIYDKHFNKL